MGPAYSGVEYAKFVEGGEAIVLGEDRDVECERGGCGERVESTISGRQIGCGQDAGAELGDCDDGHGELVVRDTDEPPPRVAADHDRHEGAMTGPRAGGEGAEAPSAGRPGRP